LLIFFSRYDIALKNRIYIRGKALHCSLGSDTEAIVHRLKAGQVKPDFIPLSQVKADYSRPYFLLSANGSRQSVDDQADFYQILFKTVAKALNDAGLAGTDLDDTAVFFGSTAIDIPLYEENYKKSRNALSRTAFGYGNIADTVAQRFGLTAGCYTFTTACTSSANGILYAASLMARGDIQRALVVGYDLFSHLGFYGFESLKLISPSTCRPFDKDRDGIIMGEGCAALILDREAKANDDFYYRGGANICDIHSVTTHNPAGDQIASAMHLSLRSTGIAPQQITAVKAHATGSYQNDLTEGNGIRTVFGDRIPPITALKPYIGHTVGACGATETILFTEAVKHKFIPAVPGFENIDPEIDIQPLTLTMPIQSGTFLLNFFGFGGNCVSLIFSNDP
jgi:3-oxoacyl-[acyl-carrier-protein] synthase-1